MKKINIPAFLYAVGGLLILGFGLRLGADYLQFYPYGSCPFYVYVFTRGLCFLLPALLCMLVGAVLSRRETGSIRRELLLLSLAAPLLLFSVGFLVLSLMKVAGFSTALTHALGCVAAANLLLFFRNQPAKAAPEEPRSEN